jgi:hypothetical protein
MQNAISHSPWHFWSLDEGVDLSWDFESRPSNKNAISLLECFSYLINTQGFKAKTLERVIIFLQNWGQETKEGVGDQCSLLRRGFSKLQTCERFNNDKGSPHVVEHFDDCIMRCT